jgi:lipid-A-disaccharide synthase-like uncharacterized protein
MPCLASLTEWVEGVLNKLTPWSIVGFAGQFIFFLRFFVQWIATERKKRTVIPVAFWYLSLAGSLITLVYAVHEQDPVFIAAFSLNMLIYIRNLYFIYRRRLKAIAVITERQQRQQQDREQ